MAMQGNGKVRLIAKKGRFQESDLSRKVRQAALMGSVSNGFVQESLLNAEDEGFGNYYVEFDATPDITESGSVSYFEAGEIRGPSSILMYMGSPSRSFSINAKLIARNSHEARKVDSQIHILKSWRMPESYTGGIEAGTPTLLYLQGYGKMFKDIPVVMTDLSIEFSSEHDYLTAGSENIRHDYKEYYNETIQSEADSTKTRERKRFNKVYTNKQYDSAVPIITGVTITLKEAHSVEGEFEGLETFDILKYRTGTLVSW